jgi:Na+:H+ antiporter
MQSSFDLLTMLLVMAALSGYVNHRFLHLPLTVALLLIALGGSILLIGIDAAVPGLYLKSALREMLVRINLPSTLFNGFLSFLLFAGALEVDFANLFARKWMVLALALFGTLLSALLVAAALFAVARAFGLGLPPAWCFVFGTLISPTDPVAVLLVLKRVGVPPTLQATIAGESLFNDGIGVVLFTLALSLAETGPHGVAASAIVEQFLREAVGGGLLGLALGYGAFLLMRPVDDYSLELIISLALVTCTLTIAHWLGLSSIVAVVVAGILMGNQGMELAMSETTRHHFRTFWLLVDDTLNALLFLLIGLEIAAIDLYWTTIAATAAMIPLVLAIRWLSVAASALPLSLHLPGRFGGLVVLTWGGLRGGLSVALALSLPETEYKGALLTIAYGIVVFSIVVQGLTLDPVARRVLPHAPPAD